ncbi:Bkd operon transcriptional regulator [Paraburkholderia kururiensis]|uniref:Lrp/AsnC family transcriptional regulator n=1 Tax=Paraburkholderia kururiensis TaxID=984307 RepID=UPI000346BF38|nr:Lrp/AsnC family transcriptional regulator [Paraburkholderia kururiensis]
MSGDFQSVTGFAWRNTLTSTLNFENSIFAVNNPELDRIDRAILSAVQADGRIPNARLAETVGLSETPCARRLKRLEQEGYIERYRAMLSREALGLGVVAFVYVRFAVHDRALADRFEREVLAIPRILSCHNVSGSADYILQVVARDLDDYGTFMRDELRCLPGVTSVESSLSLREVKANGGLPVP